LPVDFNRLEQRIGRLDRFGRNHEPAEVIVFDEPGSAWVGAHVRLLADGIRIFDRSIATLHAPLGVLYQEIRARMLSEGHGTFEFDLDKIHADLESELEEIDLVEELESVAVGGDFDDARVAELRDSERGGARFRTAFSALVHSSGGIGLQSSEDPQGVVRFNNARGVRFPGLSTDEGDQIRPFLARRMAFDRALATRREGIFPLRIGDQLVDWLAEHLRTDERGRARAFVRPTRGARIPVLCLLLDFMIEFDPSMLGTTDPSLRPRLRRRGDALLPPMLLRTLSTADGPVTDTSLIAELEAPFHPPRDKAISGPGWARLFDDLSDWQQSVRLSQDSACSQLRSDPALASSVKASLTRADEERTARAAILRSRAQRLRGATEKESARAELERERRLADALQQGIAQPRVTLSACGIVLLWPANG
jgi:ATP-dependent helicase HepA